ncbi:MAG: hypothetical protein GX070_09710 [Alcaligenaceae bacterium]|nr:hypothetical protein [Alcaligenaceae bacterium]
MEKHEKNESPFKNFDELSLDYETGSSLGQLPESPFKEFDEDAWIKENLTWLSNGEYERYRSFMEQGSDSEKDPDDY